MNIILKTIKKELLKESAGISTIVRDWAKTIKKVVEEESDSYEKEQREKQQKTEPKKEDPFYWEDEQSSIYGKKSTNYDDYLDYYSSRYGNYGNYGTYGSYSYVEPLKQVIIYGENYPELYKNFPVDIWVLDNSNVVEYDHYESGYEKGEYVVYLSMPLKYISLTHLNHEVKHAFDDWNRISSGGKAIKDTWEIKNIYTKDFEKLILGDSKKFHNLGKIIDYLYKASKLETPAYLETELDTPSFNYLDIGRNLKKFNLGHLIDKNGQPFSPNLQKEFDKLKKYDVPLFKKFEKVGDFLNWSKKYLNKRGDDIFRRSAKMRYVHNVPENKPYQYQKPLETDFENFGGWKYNKETGWSYGTT